MILKSDQLNAPHPTSHNNYLPGYHYSTFSSTGLDGTLEAPHSTNWNSGETVSAQTGWPMGASPSDAVFDYDTLYQLVGESRDYVTGSSEAWDDALIVRDDDGNTEMLGTRVRELSWSFDSRGSMTTWEEIPDDAGETPLDNHFGRALGGKIVNGFQLNQTNGCDMNALADVSTGFPSNCKKPDALYFATNLESTARNTVVEPGKGTCVWAEYDVGGRMIEQVIRKGCQSCGQSWDERFDDLETECDGIIGEVEPEAVLYIYTWDAYGQLSAAEKHEGTSGADLSHSLTMAYLYNSGGGRVIREKHDPADPYALVQDVWIGGGYERRQVQLRDSADAPVSMGGAVWGDSFKDTPDTRLIKYTSGLRVQWELEPGQDHIITNPTDPSASTPQIFITFGNHLGSTSAVVDYQTGDLVEWKTNYAYGADESHWKNEDEKYDNAEEPYGFTGKEEDQAVGLHYLPLTNGRPVCLFCTPSSSWTSYTKDGARYYSSYIGRWLSPDPVPMHGGAFTNYYNYGGNSPYIYVDPDGRWIHIVIGAVVGAVVGAVTGAIQGGLKGAFIGAGIGAVAGAAIAATGGAAAGAFSGIGAGASFTTAGGAALVAGTGVGAGATIAGAAAGGAMAAGIAYGQARISGASIGQAWLSAGIAFGSSMAGGGLGSAAGSASTIPGGIAQGVALGAVVSAGATLTKVTIETKGDLSDANWDSIMSDYALNLGVSAIGSAVGAGMGSMTGKGGESSGSNMKQDTGTDEGKLSGLKGNQSLGGASYTTTVPENDDLLKVQVSVLRIRDASGNIASEQSLSNQNIGDVLNKSYAESFSGIGDRREVAVAFAQDAEGKIQASMRYGEWGAKEVDIGSNIDNLAADLGGRSNISLLAESHTHPFDGNKSLASNSDLKSAHKIYDVYGYSPRHLIIIENDKFQEY